MIEPGYRERQDAQVAKQAAEQIKYCEERFMGRPKGSTNKPKENPTVSKLADALTFITGGGTKDFQPYMQHVNLQNNYAVMSDGMISSGYPIEEELNCIPNYELLLKALKKCGKSLNITELDSGRLSIKGEGLRAIIPCLDPQEWPEIAPDAPLAVIDDRIKHGFAMVAGLADENSDRVVTASLLLEANTVTATDSFSIMQFWHGIDLPPNLIIPKIFANAVIKSKYPITAFGWTFDRSITFYFEGGMWIKTQLYEDKWPEVGPLLDLLVKNVPVPENLFEAMEAVSHFQEEGIVTFEKDRVVSHSSDEVGAQYTVKGLEPGKQFNWKYISKVAPFITVFDYNSYENTALFFGENMRGRTMSAKLGE